MYCKACGTKLLEGAAFCGNCGAPVANAIAPGNGSPTTSGPAADQPTTVRSPRVDPAANQPTTVRPRPLDPATPNLVRRPDGHQLLRPWSDRDACDLGLPTGDSPQVRPL